MLSPFWSQVNRSYLKVNSIKLRLDEEVATTFVDAFLGSFPMIFQCKNILFYILYLIFKFSTRSTNFASQCELKDKPNVNDNLIIF